MTVHEHMRMSETFMRQAHEEFAQGDRVQASEKAWGAAAHAVKAVAEHRGAKHNGHADLFDVVHALDPERMRGLHVLFVTASSLHSNFYECCLSDREIKVRIEETEEFIGMLKPLVAR